MLDALLALLRPGAAVAVAVAESQAPAALLAGTRLLVVEDNPNNQLVAAELLRRQGAEVEIVENGALAVERVAAGGGFDAVLMDLHMPVMGGLEAVRRIRALPVVGQLPVIAMTAAVMAEDRRECAAAGMDEFVPKPIDSAVLLATLVRCLGRQALAGDASTPLAEVALPTLAGFRLEQALARLDGNRDELYQLLHETAGQIPEYCRRLATAADPAALREVLHLLKGLLANLGGDLLAARAAELEKRCFSVSTVSPEMRALNAAFQVELTQAAAEIVGAIPAGQLKMPVVPLSPAERSEFLRYLRDDEYPPLVLVEKLRGEVGQMPELALALRCLDNFDYAAALKALAVWRDQENAG